MMRQACRLAGAGALALLVTVLQAMAAGATDRRPNIILVLADDMGYGDVGFNGQTRIRTPHLDALAAQGMVLNHHYAGAPSCSPSRASLMTGMHLGHCKVNNNGMVPLRPEDRTFAEVLQGAGYDTRFVGKWGLGGAEYYPVVELVRGSREYRGDGSLIPGHLHGLPTAKGFNTSYGYLNQTAAHYYFPEFLHRNLHREPLPGNADGVPYVQRDAYAPDFMTRDVLNSIAKADGNTPLFLKYANIIPHRETKFPRDPHEAAIPPTGRNAWYPYEERDWEGMDPAPLPVDKAYAAMITFMDDEIGRIAAAINANPAIRDNTLLIVTSDNGPQQTDGHTYTMFDSSGGLRENKFHLHEGGIRVPFLAVWPGRIPEGARSDHPSYFADYLATFAEIVGAPVPGGTDSISFLPTLLDQPGQEQHDYMVWTQYGRRDRPVEAIRKQKTADGSIWKLLRWADGTLELYNLADDPAETTNRADDNPDIALELEAALNARVTGPKDYHAPVLRIEGAAVPVPDANVTTPCARPAVPRYTGEVATNTVPQSQDCNSRVTGVVQVYELDLGRMPMGATVSRSFRVRNAPAGVPAHFMIGNVAVDCVTDTRLSLQSRTFGPLVDGAVSTNFDVTLTGTHPGILIGQYIKVDAYLYALGGSVPDAPIVIRVVGEVVDDAGAVHGTE